MHQISDEEQLPIPEKSRIMTLHCAFT